MDMITHTIISLVALYICWYIGYKQGYKKGVRDVWSILVAVFKTDDITIEEDNGKVSLIVTDKNGVETHIN